MYTHNFTADLSFHSIYVGTYIIFFEYVLIVPITLTDLITKTVKGGGSNSVLLLGPRGVGKTLLVDLVLQKSRDENKIFRKDGLTVKLHGLLETDDKLALKQIAKQLKLENVEGERVTLQSDFKIISSHFLSFLHAKILFEIINFIC